MSDIGWVYCFGNDSMPGIYKIGLTMRTPEERLAEANAADTWRPPSSYTIIVTKRVHYAALKEKQLHTILTELGFRVHPRREFFNAPLSIITNLFALIDEAPSVIVHVTEDDNTDDSEESADNDEAVSALTKTTYMKESCMFCEWSGRTYRLPYHYIAHHIDKVQLRQAPSEHCIFASVPHQNENLEFCLCLTCKKGTADSGYTSNSSRWVTMHAKQESCKAAHPYAFKLLKQRMGLSES